MLQIDERGSANTIDIDETSNIRVPVRIYGHNNRIFVGKNVVFEGHLLEIIGSGCTISLDDGCIIRGHIRCRHDHTHVRFGKNTTTMGVKMTLHEAGTITIGSDCMISGEVRMDVSDMHSIIDLSTGNRINKAQDITIGDHVWIGFGVTVLKGCVIGNGSVIGEKSLARGNIPKNVVAAGVPTRIIRENVEWKRERI